MEQTSLNLIAIAVFLMTLSALLTPILEISPFIPALATVGILGLVSLDSLGWQGKGLTLVLGLLASPEEKQRIVHHEAGHFLVAYCLGIPVTGYTLSAWEAFKQGQLGYGGVRFDLSLLSEVKIKETPLIFERFSTVWMAGIAAEMLIYGNSTGGQQDRQTCREMMVLGGINPQNYQQKERWAILQAKTLIEKHQDTYQALGQIMTQGASVEECYQLINQKFLVCEQIKMN
ncbi:MAG TPA: ATP-dependent Zn protease [Cyanothece sp. UBA12306]|nr:ATP-dependent Zn protease [Cyanothece sp. UBA12306]